MGLVRYSVYIKYFVLRWSVSQSDNVFCLWADVSLNCHLNIERKPFQHQGSPRFITHGTRHFGWERLMASAALLSP